MKLFGKKSSNIIGVDIGAGGVKLVELGRRRGRPYLHTYGFTDAPIARGSENANFLPVDEVAGLIKDIAAKARISTRHARAALPASAIMSAVITLAGVDRKEYKSAVEREARKILQEPFEEMAIDFKPLPPTKEEKERGEQLVLLTAAPKRILAVYSEIFKKAGLELAAIEAESIALIRALVGNDPSTQLAIDVGADQTDLFFISRGAPLVYRTLKIGGNDFTATLARTLQLDSATAEQMKRDLASSPALPAGEHGLPQIFVDQLRPLFDEIRYVLQTAHANSVEKIVLTGGSSLLPGFDKILEEQFKVKAYVGDPWSRVQYDDALKPMVHAIGPRFSVAVGLALGE